MDESAVPEEEVIEQPPLPEEAVPAEELVAVPEPVEDNGYRRVRYDPPPNTETPVQHAGKYWHRGTTFLLSAEARAQLVGYPGFTVLESGTAPTPRSP